MANSKKKGDYAEMVAERFLSSKGYLIVAQNYYGTYGEIDRIAKDGKTIVFVEVKYRATARHGLPSEAVNRQKMNRIIQTAQQYLSENGCFDTPCRFDIIEIIGTGNKKCIRHIEDAFCLE